MVRICSCVSRSHPWHQETAQQRGRAGQQKSKPFSPSGKEKLLLFTQKDSMGQDVTSSLVKTPFLKMHPVFPPR